ncbi:hypothetical protein HYX13_03000 [Candidatus Woesearchaeota archaeon]|nr:hypothetical protein [Candidatus Woesearchaeota archaeon]
MSSQNVNSLEINSLNDDDDDDSLKIDSSDVDSLEINSLKIDFSVHSLENRITAIVDRLGFFPSQELMHRNTYFAALVREAEARHGNLESCYRSMGGEQFFQQTTAKIPSQRQLLAAATIAVDGARYGRKKIEMSIPGSQKTGGVLLAVDLLSKKYLPQIAPGKRLKTLYVCPSGLVPVMEQEARKFLPKYRGVSITQGMRQEELLRAADPETDIIFLGYELSFRSHTLGIPEEAEKQRTERVLALYAELPTRNAALERLARTVGNERTEKFAAKSPSWNDVIQKVFVEEAKHEANSIITQLEQRVFTPEQPSYVILGEAHNLVDMDSRRAQALVSLWKNARWGDLETGTAFRSSIRHMSFLMHLLGFVEHTEQYSLVVKDDPKRVRSALQLYRIEPVITDVQQIDSQIPLLQEHPSVEYQPSKIITETYVALLNSELFTGAERTYLARILIAHPKNLDPDHFDPQEKEMYRKIHTFFDQFPHLLQGLRQEKSCRAEAAKKIIESALEQQEKVLVFCEHNITEILEKEFAKYGCRRIDQTTSLEMKDGLADRHLALIEAARNPDIRVVVTTRGILREGLDAREFTTIIEYEPTTLEFRREQSIARAYRSGQRRQVQVYQLLASGLGLDERIAAVREWRQHIDHQIYEGDNPSAEEIEAYLRDLGKLQANKLQELLDVQGRGYLATIFNSLVGRGSAGFAEEMKKQNRTRLLPVHFNYRWQYTYSANCARLLCENIIPKLEETQGNLEDILDGACGPATISRTLRKPTTNVDILRLQLEFGEDACQKVGIANGKYVLGSIHNLQSVIPLEATDDEVFDPQHLTESYPRQEKIPDASQDLYVCSLGMYYLNQEERAEFFQEAKRVLRNGKPLLLLIPRSKIATSCEVKFLEDIEASGFTIDRDISGIYAAAQATNVETGEQQGASSFEPYVIVAYNQGTVLPIQKEYSLSLGYDIIPSIPTEEKPLSVADHQKPHVVYSGFYRKAGPQKIQSLSLSSLFEEVNGGKEVDESKGIEGEKSTGEEESTNIEERVRRLAEEKPEAVRDMLSKLSDIFGGNA